MSTSLSEINVVPLVDVILVMLIVFMVAAPMMQRGLDVNLPQARRAEAISAERLFVTVPLSFRTDGKIGIVLGKDIKLYQWRIAYKAQKGIFVEKLVVWLGHLGISVGQHLV